MKFAAAILLIAQLANADGHADTAAEAAVHDLGDHAEMHPDHMAEANLDEGLESHIGEQHERLAMALEMVEMFCDHHEHDSDKAHDTTDGEKQDMPEGGDAATEGSADMPPGMDVEMLR